MSKLLLTLVLTLLVTKSLIYQLSLKPFARNISIANVGFYSGAYILYCCYAYFLYCWHTYILYCLCLHCHFLSFFFLNSLSSGLRSSASIPSCACLDPNSSSHTSSRFQRNNKLINNLYKNIKPRRNTGKTIDATNE